MARRFEGKVAVVTGAGRGIGREVALLLAAEGASVLVNDQGWYDGTGPSQVPADQVVARIRSNGGSAAASYDDVSTMDGGKLLIETALDSFGRLDVLVNSSTALADGNIDEMTAGDFDRVISRNVKGTFVATKYAAIQFRQQRSGRIVNVALEPGSDKGGRTISAAASEAIVGMTRTVGRDLGKYGVTCNALLYTEQAEPPARARGQTDTASPSKESLETGVLDGPENAAAMAVLLCTDLLPHVNGHVFGASGGGLLLYSQPEVERSLHSWGTFDVAELEELVPAALGPNPSG